MEILFGIILGVAFMLMLSSSERTLRKAVEEISEGRLGDIEFWKSYADKLQKHIDKLEGRVTNELDFNLYNEFCLVSVGEAYWTLIYGDVPFSIEDYHQSGDYTGPMKFKKRDAQKLQRFLNNYYKGDVFIFNSTTYNRIKSKLDITTGLYAE